MIHFRPIWHIVLGVRALVFPCLILAAAVAPAITRRDDVPDAHYLLAATAHPSVGLFNTGSGTGDAVRTGTLIGDKFVLTAGHNLPPVGSSPTFTVGGQTYNVISWSRHPSYTTQVLQGSDLLVARLGQRVLNVAPSKLHTVPVMAGTEMVLVGSGGSGTGTQGVTLYDQRLRSASNVVDVDPAYANVFLCDFDAPNDPSKNSLSSIGSAAEPTTREGTSAAGDSGGPALVSINGEWRIVGVISAIFQFDGSLAGSYSDGTLFSRTQPALSFIRDRAWETGRVDGIVTLEDLTIVPTGRMLTVQLLVPGTETLLETVTVPLAADGGYSFVTSRRGATDLRFSVAGYLRKRATNANITNNGPSGLNASLTAGDVNNDNEIGPADFSALSAAFGTFDGDAGYVQAADLNRDGEIGPLDFAILAGNFGEFGD